MASVAGQTATLLPDGRVLFAAGWDGTDIIGTSQVYGPRDDTWGAAAPLGEARVSAQAVPLVDGRVLVVGGASDVDGRLGLASAELYGPVDP